MIHEQLEAARAAPSVLAPWWGAYLAGGPHADDYLVGAILRAKLPGDPQRWAVAWAARGTPDPDLLTEAAEEADRYADICRQIRVPPGAARIVAPPDWVLAREDWACLVAAHQFRCKIKPAAPGLDALISALARWDAEARRLRAEGLRLAQNPPWVTARFSLVAATVKGWWLPKLEAK